MNQQFTKIERLCGKREINNLFDNGNKLFSYPYRVFWMLTDDDRQDAPVKILISVSKRGFKKAVDRNKIKRYIKEAYRTQKLLLWEVLADKKVQIAILYIEKEKKDFQFHKNAIRKLLLKIAKEIH